jgi:hypothetical protein
MSSPPSITSKPDPLCLQTVAQMLGVAYYYSDGLSATDIPADGYLGTGMGFRNLSNFDANPVFQTLLA